MARELFLVTFLCSALMTGGKTSSSAGDFSSACNRNPRVSTPARARDILTTLFLGHVVQDDPCPLHSVTDTPMNTPTLIARPFVRPP